MEQNVDEFVRSVIITASNSPDSSVGPETQLVDINMDSLALASVIAQVEAVHQLELEPEEVVRIFGSATVGDVIAAVSEVLCARA
jgi:acyl carrier protein